MNNLIGSSSGNFGEEEGETNHPGNGKKSYHRHTSQQIQALEAYFKQCPHPNDQQRRHISNELGLESNQIKFWFQNKRTQTKAQSERADNSVLRAENERIEFENHAFREALKNVICTSCGGPQHQRQNSLEKLKLQNDQLKKELKLASNMLAKYTGKATSLTPIIQTPMSFSHETTSMSRFPYLGVTHIQTPLISETAAIAMDELIRLLRTDEPFWVKSPQDGRYIIHREKYEKAFPRVTHVRSSSARIESSKHSALVTMNAARLVSMFLDADKWVDLFPTMVTEAKTIQVFETGMDGNKNGSLRLMYERVHVLSPFVPPREFYFLRHCREIEDGLWVLVDVSHPFFKEASYSWKLPSGCMIQEMPNGSSKVTWVEHVEVDDKRHTHRLYRDIVVGGSAYGSERRVLSLQRMCERLSVFSKAKTSEPFHYIGRTESGGEADWKKKRIMKLSHRMVKSFCSILNMSGNLGFPQPSDVTNSGVQVSVRHTTETGQTKGTIVTAATSIWLPLPHQSVFHFLKDHKIRHQWDVLCNGNPIKEMTNISTGNVPGNYISIVQPFVPKEKNMMVLQECCYNEYLEGMVVYAPISLPAMNIAINGDDSSDIPILPSGFIVSDDTGVAAANSRASLLTVAFQILVSSSSKELNVQSIATVNNLLASTVQRLKALLGCSDLDSVTCS